VGFVLICLGLFTLRCDTACLALLGVLRYLQSRRGGGPVISRR